MHRNGEHPDEAGQRGHGASPRLPDNGAMIDEHGRPPGVASRTGTGSMAPPANPDRIERALEDERSRSKEDTDPA